VAARLEQRIEEHAGLSVPRWVLASRVQARARAHKQPVDEYVERACAADTQELGLLIEALRVGETRFFRHAAQLAALTEVVIPTLRQRPGPVRGWSAGCATGEEAYTLAMVLAQSLPPPRYPVSVLGTDISDGALEVARAATYGADELRHVPQRWRARGFQRDSQDTWKIAPRIANLVRFEQQNLADARFPRELDVVMCRNVLIYFSAEARRQVVRQMVDCLNVGGFLFVGYSESLREFGELELIRAGDGVVYRKPGGVVIASTGTVSDSDSDSGTGTGMGTVSGTGAGTGMGTGTVSGTGAGTGTGTGTGTGAGTVSDSDSGCAADQIVIALRGRYDDDARLSKELSPALSGSTPRVVVDLDGADYLADDVAAVLRRAAAAAGAAGVELQLRATRPGTRRWLRRNDLAGEGDA